MYQSIYGNKCSRDSDGIGIMYTQITLREITFCPRHFETDPHKCHFTDTSYTSSSRGWKTDPEKRVPEAHLCCKATSPKANALSLSTAPWFKDVETKSAILCGANCWINVSSRTQVPSLSNPCPSYLRLSPISQLLFLTGPCTVLHYLRSEEFDTCVNKLATKEEFAENGSKQIFIYSGT